jgi:enoyl-CoA hydratase
VTETLRREDHGPVRVLVLARGKANALVPELAAALVREIREAESDPAVRAAVLTSASPTIFCAGFDLAVLGAADNATFDTFARTFETLFLDLFLFGKPLVVALTGHAVAGGALLAGTADFRFAAEGPGTIGLPGARLGVRIPRYCLEALRASIGHHALTRWALSGEAIPFAEARDIGAVDRILRPEALLDGAVAFAARLGEAPSEVYAGIKRDLRGEAADRARAHLAEGRQALVESWFSAAGRHGTTAALERLKRD